MTNAKRLIVAITGASGSLYALALLKILEQAGVMFDAKTEPGKLRVIAG